VKGQRKKEKGERNFLLESLEAWKLVGEKGQKLRNGEREKGGCEIR
jgi:hypothetical protein